jgi:hypothetical protein
VTAVPVPPKEDPVQVTKYALRSSSPFAAVLTVSASSISSIKTVDFVGPSTERTPLLGVKRHEMQSPVTYAPATSALGALSALPAITATAEAHGWTEHALPDGAAYFHHAARRLTADTRALAKAELAPPAGDGRGELWIRDGGECVWVDHGARSVRRVGRDDGACPGTRVCRHWLTAL